MRAALDRGGRNDPSSPPRETQGGSDQRPFSRVSWTVRVGEHVGEQPASGQGQPDPHQHAGQAYERAPSLITSCTTLVWLAPMGAQDPDLARCASMIVVYMASRTTRNEITTAMPVRGLLETA